MSEFKRSKHVARFAAIQLMYQKDITGFKLSEIADNFIKFYLDQNEDYKNIHKNFFLKLISNFEDDTNCEEIIKNSLTAGKEWGIGSAVSNAILKVAIIEMIFQNTDIPVIINEYVNLAKEFIDQKGVKFINAILDKVSKQVDRKCFKEA